MKRILKAHGLKCITIERNDVVDQTYIYDDELLHRKIFVVYYHSELSEDDFSTCLDVITYDDKSTYYVGVYNEEFASQIIAYRAIIDIVHLIKSIDSSELIEILNSIALSYSSSEIQEGELKITSYLEGKSEIDYVIELVQQL